MLEKLTLTSLISLILWAQTPELVGYSGRKRLVKRVKW